MPKKVKKMMTAQTKPGNLIGIDVKLNFCQLLTLAFCLKAIVRLHKRH